MEPFEIWGMVFEIVRKQLPVPTLWLAMQAVKPLLIDGSYFVAALPPHEKYLADTLQDNQTSSAIEDALKEITGRILAFRLIKGETAADWQQQKAEEARAEEAAAAPPPVPAPVAGHVVMGKAAPATPSSAPASAQTTTAQTSSAKSSAVYSSAESLRPVSPTWEKLNERLMYGYKAAPFIKYPHGQAQFVLSAVRCISDTMDIQMPPPGAARDDQQERALAKVIERLGSIVNLDPLFLSLELLRFREAEGKKFDSTL